LLLEPGNEVTSAHASLNWQRKVASRNARPAGWLLAELRMRGPVGFNRGRRSSKQRVNRLRYSMIEVITEVMPAS